MASTRIYTPNEIKLMTAQGKLGMLSGDKVLAPFGKQMLSDSQAAQELLSDNEQKDSQRAVLSEYYGAQARNWQEGDKIEREKMAQSSAEKAKDRALERELKRMGIDADAAARVVGELKASSVAEQKAREAERLSLKATELKDTMPKGGVRENMDMIGSWVSKVDPALGQRFINKNYDADQNQWRSDADAFDQDLSNLAAGLAVTGFELENKQKWSPRAPGLTPKESQDRFDNIASKFSAKALAARGRFNKDATNAVAPDPTARRRKVKGWSEDGTPIWEN